MSGRRRRIAAICASGMSPSRATGMLRPKWSSSTCRPASAAAWLMVATASLASAGVSREPSQPSARRPTRRSPPGAEPPSQISSGLAGRGLMLGAFDGEELAVEGDALGGQQQAEEGERFVEDGGALFVGYGEEGAFGGLGGLEAEHRQHPGRGEPGQAGQLLGDQHRMPAGQHRDPAARLEPPGPGEGERHPGERLDGRGVHVLGQPQRVHPLLLEEIDRRGELAGLAGRAQGHSDPNLHDLIRSQCRVCSRGWARGGLAVARAASVCGRAGRRSRRAAAGGRRAGAG